MALYVITSCNPQPTNNQPTSHPTNQPAKQPSTNNPSNQHANHPTKQQHHSHQAATNQVTDRLDTLHLPNCMITITMHIID